MRLNAHAGAPVVSWPALRDVGVRPLSLQLSIPLSSHPLSRSHALTLSRSHALTLSRPLALSPSRSLALAQGPGGQEFLEKFGGKDICMLRMLRARKFDVDAAATLVQEILAYRAEHGLDGLLQVLLPSAPLSSPPASTLRSFA